MTLLVLIVLINLPLIIFHEEYKYDLVKIESTEKAATEIHSIHYLKVEHILVWVQTIACICALLLNIERNNSLIIAIKFTFFELIYLTLFGDVLCIGMIVYNLFLEKELDIFWTNETENENSAAPERLYFFVSSVLTFYFVIKLCAAWLVLRSIWIFCDGESNDAYFMTADDIEREENSSYGQTALPPRLPSYDQCVIKSELPPSYDIALLKEDVDYGSPIVES